MSNSFFDWTASLTRFVKFDAARAEDLNTALDSVSSGFEDVETKTNAAIKLPDGETSAALGNATARKGKVLGFNASTGAAEAVTTYDQISSAQGYATAASASAAAALVSEGNALTHAGTALGYSNDSQASADASAVSAALSSSAALNNLTPRSYFFFTM